MTIRDILNKKGHEVFTISQDKTIVQAMNVLAQNNIGVILALDSNAKLIGILSERDIVRVISKSVDEFKDILIKDIMTKDIIFIEPGDGIDYVESIMTKNHIRHLPVVDNKALVGMISIGDIVKSILKKSQHENKYLQDYISGGLV